MSVQTQIDRISGAVSAALTALSEKGVTVPAGTKVDGIATLIAAIEIGGGGADLGPFSQIITGTITPSADMQNFALPYEVIDTVVLFAIGRLGELSMDGVKDSYTLGSGVYASFTTKGIAYEDVKIGTSVNCAGYSYSLQKTDNIMNFNISAKLSAGANYGYIICTTKTRPYYSASSGGGNND